MKITFDTRLAWHLGRIITSFRFANVVIYNKFNWTF